MAQDRITLEVKITEMEQLVSELNGVIYEQQKRIDQLLNRMNALEAKLETSVGEGTLPVSERPPHY